MATDWTSDSLEQMAHSLATRVSFNPQRETHPPMLTDQPIHTVYGGAQLFRADTCQKLQKKARDCFLNYAPDAAIFAAALGMQATDPQTQEWLIQQVFKRVQHKLNETSIEDFRIDFEDGFGPRSPGEEDAAALQSSDALAQAQETRGLPRRIGIRIKSLAEPTRARAIRTLTFFLCRFLSRTDAILPTPFVVTLPKIDHKSHVAELHGVLTQIESQFGLAQGTIKVEIMVETPGSLMDRHGRCPLGSYLAAGKGRVLGAHLGAYDLTAALDVPAPFQDLAHPSCTFARHTMKIALAGSGVELVDGALNILPIGTIGEVHAAWRLSYSHVQRAIREGFYQGWDLHPAQIPPRYAALYAFFLDHLKSASQRLKAFLDTAAQASRVGAVFDDAASGLGLLNFFRRGYACGAFVEEDLKGSGLALEDLGAESFAQLVAYPTE